jgi:hypothetical protein
MSTPTNQTENEESTQTTPEEKPLPPTIQEYILFNRQDAVLWKADYLLHGVTSPVTRNAKFEELAHMIALIDKPVTLFHERWRT